MASYPPEARYRKARYRALGKYAVAPYGKQCRNYAVMKS